MSLRVWLPLDGTLDNQGLDDVVVTNNGATIDNSGKIGKCYNFDGSNDYISFPYSFPSEDWSYSIWFYTTSTNTQTLGCCRNGVGFGFSIFLISNKVRIDGIIGNDNQQWKTIYTYPTDTWTNLIVTSKNGLIKYYINGEYQTSKNITVNNTKLGNVFTIGASQTNGNNLGNYFKGKINDVRIYDHALSPFEVKQISQGLILHYPLNNNGFGQENLYGNGGDCIEDLSNHIVREHNFLLNHEHIIINVCNETINQLEDEDLISFIENEISIHETNKNNLMSLLEDCANE